MNKTYQDLVGLFTKIEDWLNDAGVVDNAKIEENFQEIAKLYDNYTDPFGLNLEKTKAKLRVILPLYKHYFKVRLFGQDNAKTERPLMVVSNHSGQIPIDAMLLTLAFFYEVSPPKILRSMVERFVNAIPFFGTWASESGAVLGDRANCLYLLNRGESILVFPEGVRGVSKSTKHYYQLQSFTTGFFRMALSSGVDILPVAVVGAEEFYPWVHHDWKLAKLLKLPALPLTPTVLLGPLGLLPLPSPVDIHIGPIYSLPAKLSAESPDSEIDHHVRNIENIIKDLITEGLKIRRPFFANIESIPQIARSSRD